MEIMKNVSIEALLDPASAESSGRFAFLFSVILSNVAVWYVWLFACTWQRQIVDIPEGVVMLYAAAQGLSFMGKAGQRWAERGMKTASSGSVENGTAKSYTEM